jgi:hypothetical protein
VTPLMALLLIAVTYAAEVLVRCWHIVPRSQGLLS